VVLFLKASSQSERIRKNHVGYHFRTCRMAWSIEHWRNLPYKWWKMSQVWSHQRFHGALRIIKVVRTINKSTVCVPSEWRTVIDCSRREQRISLNDGTPKHTRFE
jgi:hypothetical protein